MGNSLALGLYLAWSGRGGLSYANRKLQERLKAGKEDPDASPSVGARRANRVPTGPSSGSTPPASAKASRYWN
jgi:hypothetical protein